MTKFKYSKGSEWRRWDLHIHTKDVSGYAFSSENSISSREQNDDEYPKIFIEYIYSIDNLGVVAITDHNSANWIDRMVEANKSFIRQNKQEEITILPGVEVESSDGIHLLVIFNPETQLEEVKRNYRKINWKETIEHFITATKNPSNPNTLKTTEEIMEEAEKWDAVCIFAHVTSDKGFFKISSGDRKTKIYKHNLTQIFQIPNEGITNEGYSNIINGRDPNYGNISVTKITASDAKKLRDIGTNNCWIKADPTFEGLKQIIYEPEERIYIGEEPPRKLERDKIIKSITISNSRQWFEDNKQIPLNEGLVSIIGGKGTGKTAILDLIAYATRSYNCYEKDETKSKSFLKKAFRELKGSKIKVEWDDGLDEIIIGDKLEESTKEGKLRYLPQDFIDQLCSEIGKSELEGQIENVIFQKIPPENKANFTDFKDYKEAQLIVINDKKDRIAKQIEEINSKIYEHNELIKSKDSKIEKIKKIESDVKKFEQEMKKILDFLEDSKDQKEILAKLNSSIEQNSNLQKIISELSTKLRKIEEIKNEINKFVEDSEKFIKRLKTDLKTVGIEDIEKIKVVLYPEDLEQILDSRKKEIEDEIKKQKVELDSLGKNIKNLNSKITLEKSKQDKIKEINKSLSDLKKKRDSLNSDIEKIKEAEKILPDLFNNQKNLFINYFELIFEERGRLKEIYSPLENLLKESAEENEKLFEFTVKFNFDLNTMTDEGHELIDLRADGIFRHTKPEVLREELEELSFKLNLDEEKVSETDKKSIKNFVKNVEGLFTKNNRSIFSQLKEKRYVEQDFYNWLYSTKYYSISYSIKFNGLELDNLSPGLKGVALLILFLELDKEDKRPIFIDQPEENLDNRSVYLTLMRYFRSAKNRRQVIIVTHNPNLVVNADSEQVIVANFDRSLENQVSRISYVSGSLENTFKDESVSSILEKKGIREHVCEILEGGEKAFKQREKKYGFKT